MIQRSELVDLLALLATLVNTDTDSICPRAHLSKFRAHLATLRSLTISLENAYIRAESDLNALAMSFGISSLPDELLAIILGHASSSLQDASRLSHVSSRFRSIVLSSPEIWSNCELMLHSTSKQISTIAERSRARHLKARIEPFSYCPLNFTGIMALSDRLEELYISPINEPILYYHFVATRLPVLRHLTMRWSKYLDRQLSDKPLTHIYETWLMPRLQSIDTDFIPRPMFDATPTQCKLTFNEDPIHVSELLKFLGSSSRIEVLNIVFLGTSAWHENAEDPIIRMPNLRSFTLEISRRASASLLTRFLSSLNCDNLSDMSILMKENLRIDESFNTAFGIDSATDYTNTKPESANRRQRSNAIRQFIQRHNRIRTLAVSIEWPFNRKTIPHLSGLDTLEDIITNLPKNIEILTLLRNVVLSWDVPPQYQSDSKPPTLDCIRITGQDDWTLKVLNILKAKLPNSNNPIRIQIPHSNSNSDSDLESNIRTLFPNSRLSSF